MDIYINVFVSNLVQKLQNDIFCSSSTPHVHKNGRFLSSVQFFISIQQLAQIDCCVGSAADRLKHGAMYLFNLNWK
jgi:hypothetical protein